MRSSDILHTMGNVIAIIVSFISIFFPAVQPLNKNVNNFGRVVQTIPSPTSTILTPSISPITHSITGIPIQVTSAVVNMKDLAKKQAEIDKYKESDTCYIAFKESGSKTCPPGCSYQPAIQPPPGSSAPVRAAQCGTRADYIPFY